MLRRTPIGIALGLRIAIEECDAGDVTVSVAHALVRAFVLALLAMRAMLLVALMALVTAVTVLPLMTAFAVLRTTMLVLIVACALLVTLLVLIAASAVLLAMRLALMTAFAVLPLMTAFAVLPLMTAFAVLPAVLVILIAASTVFVTARMILVPALAVMLAMPAVAMRIPAVRPRDGLRAALQSLRLNLILNRSLNAALDNRLRHVVCRHMFRHGNRDADELLDVAQKSFLFTVAERDRNAVGSRARGAADAMHISFGDVRHVVVHDVADAVDIYATRGNIRRNKRAHAAFAKCGKHAVALVLRFVAVDRLGGNAGFDQTAHDLVRATLGAGEDERAVDRLALEDVRQHRRLGIAVHVDQTLLDALGRRSYRVHGDPGRIAKHLVGEIGNVAWHGRGEKQSLPLRRKLRDDVANVVDEAHVEHSVGFVEHKVLNLAKPQRVAAEEIEQAARRRDKHVDAVHQRTDLPAHRYTADRQRGADANMTAVGLETVEHLAGEFARRAKHEHAAGLALHLLSPGEELVQDRQRERRGFSGAGLRNSSHVAARKCNRNGLDLDRRGLGVFFFYECA